MTGRAVAGWLAGIALLVAAGGAAWWLWYGRGAGKAHGAAVQAPAGAPATRPVSFELYYPSGDGMLHAERHDLQVGEAPKERIRKVVQALLTGPVGEGSVHSFPEGVVVGSVQLSRDGTAFVDLRWPDHEDPPAGGSTEEMQRLYSVVDSICKNVPQVSRVTLLWNGLQRDTFSGHLDTSRPLAPDVSLVSR
jgi:germination protein M